MKMKNQDAFIEVAENETQSVNCSTKDILSEVESSILDKNKFINADLLSPIIFGILETNTVEYGRTTTIDLYDLHLKGSLILSDLEKAMNDILISIEIDDRFSMRKTSRYVYEFKNQNRVKHITKLNKIQKLVYSLYDKNRNMAELGLAQLSQTEREEVELLLNNR